MIEGVQSEGFAASLRVPGPDLTGPAFAAHLAACAERDGHPMSREAWAAGMFDGFRERLAGGLTAASVAIGLTPLGLHGAPSPRMDHDRRFSAIAYGPTVEVGWRREGTDYLVAVSPTGPWRDALADGHTGELAMTGRSPESFVALHADCVAYATDHLLSWLSRHGIPVAAPVSGVSGDLLMEAARELVEATGRGFDANLAGLDAAERLEMIQALREFEANGEPQPFMLLVAAYDAASDAIVTFYPGEDGNPLGHHDVPEELRGIVAGIAATDGIGALPVGDTTLAWARSVSGERRRTFVVMAEEYAEALEEDCVVGWDGAAGRETVELASAGGVSARP